jgi:hypothetical protein
MNIKQTLAMLGISVSTFLPLVASAVDEQGHDHGAPTASTGTASPRFAADSDIFELVGVVEGKQLRVYLDRFEDNSPVKAANLDLELGGAKVALKQVADGEYEGVLDRELKPGVIAVTATVTAGSETDILAADLRLDERASVVASSADSWRRYVVAAAVATMVVVLLIGISRRGAARRRASPGGAP